MRRMQVLEAMNFAEKHGYSYILTYSPTVQYRMRFPVNTGMALSSHLVELELEVSEIVTDAIQHGWVELR